MQLHLAKGRGHQSQWACMPYHSHSQLDCHLSHFPLRMYYKVNQVHYKPSIHCNMAQGRVRMEYSYHMYNRSIQFAHKTLLARKWQERTLWTKYKLGLSFSFSFQNH